MAPRRTAQPTAAELEILQVVWERGTASVREVFEELGAARDVGYTTVLKLMQIMHEKEMLTRDASARSHRFTAALKREATQREIVANLIAKAFGGSAAQLVEAALAHARSSKTELAAIQALFVPGKRTAAASLKKTAHAKALPSARKKTPVARRRK